MATRTTKGDSGSDPDDDGGHDEPHRRDQDEDDGTDNPGDESDDDGIEKTSSVAELQKRFGLSHLAGANYSLAEQDKLVREGDGKTARNRGDLNLTGTHYGSRWLNRVSGRYPGISLLGIEVRRISRALDTIWRTAQSDDEPFTDEQFAKIYNLYHEGHKLGTHHREVNDWLEANGDPLSAVERAREHSMDANVHQISVSALANKMDAPDHVKYALPAWFGKGYNDGRGGTSHYDGIRPFAGGWRYDPPTREDPMRRNGPW